MVKEKTLDKLILEASEEVEKIDVTNDLEENEYYFLCEYLRGLKIARSSLEKISG